MTRPGPLRRVERSVRGQRPLLGVEGVDDDLVQAEVATEGELVGFVDVDRMAVLLGADVLLERRCGTQLAVRSDWDTNAASAGVIGRENVLARRIHDEVTRRPALRRPIVEKCQFSRPSIDGERADFRVPFVDRIEEFLVWMECDKGRAARLAGQRRRGQRTVLEVQLALVDPLAFLSSVSAEVDAIFLLSLRGR